MPHETSLSLVTFRNADNYWNGWALKISTFLGPEMATSEASAIWAQSIHRGASGRDNRSIICITFTSCKVTRRSIREFSFEWKLIGKKKLLALRASLKGHWRFSAIVFHVQIFFSVYYSALLHLPPLRFHCADGCWDRTHDRCNWCIGSQTL